MVPILNFQHNDIDDAESVTDASSDGIPSGSGTLGDVAGIDGDGGDTAEAGGSWEGGLSSSAR